jgi:uncharacterized protein (DUF342 family)
MNPNSEKAVYDAASQNTELSGDSAPVKAMPVVTIASDGMAAELYLNPPKQGGAALTAGELQAALAAKGVVYGILPGLLENLEKQPCYGQSIPVAQGLAPVNGAPAELSYKVNLEKDLKPRENPDGTVDYKDLGLFQTVKENDVLCEKTPATAGTTGCNVLGVTIPAKPGKDLALPMGKNTRLSDDRLQLLASCGGQVDMVGQKLCVHSIFTLNSDVSNATGNINFLGNLIINGNVLTGFDVQASGNITVNGGVEGARVVAGGNIILKEGLNGGGQGSVQAGGYIKAKYIQSGIAQAGGDIESAFIQHSYIQSGGSIYLVGSKGTLAGGRAVARNNINAVFVGGKSSPVATTLEVGNDPEAVAYRRQLEQQMETAKSQIASLSQAVTMLQEYEKKGSLTADKRSALEEALAVCGQLTENLAKLEAEFATVNEEMATIGYGIINVKKSAYPGVRIIIGPEQTLLETKYDFCSFIRGQHGITFTPYQ